MTLGHTDSIVGQYHEEVKRQAQGSHLRIAGTYSCSFLIPIVVSIFGILSSTTHAGPVCLYLSAACVKRHGAERGVT